MKLENLYKELNEVKNSTLEFLPEYGYSAKSEIIELIESEIEEVRGEERDYSYDYTPEELQSEREYLCFSQGLAY